MEQNLQLSVSLWKIQPTCYYRNSVQNILMCLSCTKVSVKWAYFTYFTISVPLGYVYKVTMQYTELFHSFKLTYTYTINMYCDYAGSVYGTTPICKQKSLHSYTQLQFTKLILLQTSLMYTTVYMHTVVVYKDTLVHDKIIIIVYWKYHCIGNKFMIFSSTQYIFIWEP